MSVNGPISPKHCYYEMDYSFYSFTDWIPLKYMARPQLHLLLPTAKKFLMSSLVFHIAIQNLQYKVQPEIWPSHRRIFKTSLYYKTRLILENWRYLELLSVAELLKAHLTCSIVGYIYHAIQLILQFHRYYASRAPNSWYWKWALQLIKYVHTDPITVFHILIIPEAIFQVRAFKFATVGALNRLINTSPGFCDNRKILFLAIV